jgi:type II secretory pathway component PulF
VSIIQRFLVWASTYDWFVRAQLSADARKNVYTLLSVMLENGQKLDDSLSELYAIFSEEGRTPGAPVAVFLQEAIKRTNEGRPINEAMARYISPEEASMIAAGERSGRLRESFTAAIDKLAKQKAILGAVGKGLAYPIFLCMFLAAIMLIVSHKLMPALAQAVDLRMLTGPLALLHTLSNIVTHHGLKVLAVLVIAVAWAGWSLPNLTGNLRYHLDKLPPWSVYRAMQGSTFLLNIGVMLRSGIPLLSILTLLQRGASPYMRERIDACIRGINGGQNLGEALYKSELDFPDPVAVRLIRVFASREGFDVALSRFANEWADSTVTRVKTAMAGVFYIALLAVGCVIGLLVLGMFDLQSLMTSLPSRR